MAEWKRTISNIGWTLAGIFCVVMCDLTTAVMTEYGILPDWVWWIAGGLNLVIGAIIVIAWKY